MTAWLDPVREKLDDVTHPVVVFFRDDDAGWEDSRLYALLDIFARHELPIDLAAIPMAVTPALARELARRIADSSEKVRVHQHGYAHASHEVSGRKCEFGPSRDKAEQRHDIEAGKKRLRELLEGCVDPIFTPPWNRCTAETGECLVELDLPVLSRESNAVALGVPGLLELPITQDWFAHRKGVRLGRDEWGRSLASKLHNDRPTGIMFHHAIMDAEEMRATEQLLSVLSDHSGVQCRTMYSISAA